MRHRHEGPKVEYHRNGKVRYRKRPMHVQTLIFPKKKFNRKEALEWAKEHGYEDYTSRETENTIRVRQIPPKDVKRYGGIFPIGEDVKGVYVEVDKDKYRDKPYPYLRRKFNISKYRDDDKDGVINKDDCRPWDKDKHFLGFGRSRFKELDYVKDGIKSTANISVSQDDPDYESQIDEVREFAKKHGLSITVTEHSDGDVMHTSIDVSSNPVAEVDWDSEDHKKIGESLGYPEKAIEGFMDKDRDENREDVLSNLMDEGISRKDLDRLEFIPYGMSVDEVKEEIEKRKPIWI